MHRDGCAECEAGGSMVSLHPNASVALAVFAVESVMARVSRDLMHKERRQMNATERCRTAAAVSLMAACAAVGAERVGSVDTTFRMVGANDKIEIEAFDDPKIEGVTCHLSRAVTGGVGKFIGTSVDTSDASIACRQIGPIKITEPLVEGEKVFSERRSAIFKTLRVVRFCDRKRNTLVYLVYSTKVIEGSPKNSISTVPMMPWQTGDGVRFEAQCGGNDEE